LTFSAFAAVAATSSTSTDNVVPGVLGFLVVTGMAVVLVFLLRSMNKQFRKIAPPADARPAPTAGQDKAPAERPSLNPWRAVPCLRER
jgi:hypothetical protein